jgi:hypothetical protein
MKNLLFLLLLAFIGCSTKQNNDCKPYYYHVTLEDDSIIISEHGRHVASVPYDQIGVLDSIFVTDNE